MNNNKLFIVVFRSTEGQFTINQHPNIIMAMDDYDRYKHITGVTLLQYDLIYIV